MEIMDKTAAVTGGASGLGEAVVRMFAAGGGNAAILDVDDERGRSLECELEGKAVFIKTDVSSEESVSAAVAEMQKRFISIHAVVNCAGIGYAQRTVTKLGPHDARAFETVIRVNLLGTFLMASRCAYAMSFNKPLGESGERGVIVNVASPAAFEGQIGQTAYAASKAGVVGMTLPMARDLSSVGVRVVTVVPGFFLTPLTMLLPKEHRQRLVESIPFPKRIGRTEEFAALVREIITNEYINGETIRIDGAVRMSPK